FLLGNDGLSNRKFVYYWLQATISAIRCAEYKWVIAGTSTNPEDVVNPGGFSGTQTTFSYGKLFNLYLDPKESHSFLIRKPSYSQTCSPALKAHLHTLQKFPPKMLPVIPLQGGIALPDLGGLMASITSKLAKA